jgi:EmrB/QacA subfamily drug resistance transporter
MGRDTDKLEPLGAPLIRLAIVLVLGAIAPLLDTTIAGVALHTLSIEFQVGTADIQWVSTAYLLAMAVAIPTTGWASRRFGTKSVWITALIVFTVGSALSGLAWSLGSLIAFRAIQGVGAGIIQPVVQTMLVRAAGPKKLGRVLTLVTLVTVLAPIIGPVAGGAILANASWRWVFYVNVPLCIVAVVAAWIVVPGAEPRVRPRLDVLGLALLAPALAGMLFGLSRASSGGGFASADVLAPLVAGALLFCCYLLHSLRVRTTPLVDLRLFRLRSFSAAGGVLFFSGFSLYGAMFLLPLYYQQARGADALVAGLMLAPQGLGSLLSRPVGGIVDRIGARRIVLLGILTCAIATLPFVFADAGTSPILLGLALVVRGAGLSAANIAIMTGAFRDVPQSGVPDASTITRILQQLGGSFGTAVLAVILTGTAGSDATAGFTSAFLWSIILTALALVPALLIPGRTGPARTGPS